uniref:Uncharacterized protein n=1 Tax=Anguilla anguilla TaxID=7936 RepID=A0A0E9Y2L9_ANGAN
MQPSMQSFGKMGARSIATDKALCSHKGIKRQIWILSV